MSWLRDWWNARGLEPPPFPDRLPDRTIDDHRDVAETRVREAVAAIRAHQDVFKSTDGRRFYLWTIHVVYALFLFNVFAFDDFERGVLLAIGELGFGAAFIGGLAAVGVHVADNVKYRRSVARALAAGEVLASYDLFLDHHCRLRRLSDAGEADLRLS